jgi:hypothetical protein
MDIAQFEHVLRASAGITDETVFVVLGSQAVLAQYPNLPEPMTRSMELDIYPKYRPDLAEVIEGAIGADSPFHGSFGYHADGVGPETARLPRSWEDRAVRFTASGGGVVAFCPEIHDLAIAKLLAGRPKDLEWLRAAAAAHLLEAARLEGLLSETDATVEERQLATRRIAALEAAE